MPAFVIATWIAVCFDFIDKVRQLELQADGVPKWTATIPTWLIQLRDTDGSEKTMHIAVDDREFQGVYVAATRASQRLIVVGT